MTKTAGKWLQWNWRSSRQRTAVALLFAVCSMTGATAGAQTNAPVVTGDARVDKLLSQMTIEEKIALIRGASEDPATNQGQAGYLTGVPRLGIPPIRPSRRAHASALPG